VVREYHTANRDKINPLKLAYMVMNVELMSETDKAVVHLMKKHELKGTFGASFPETPWLRVRRAGLCRGRPGGYAFGKVPQGGPRSRIGLRWALS
jgi:hypothetical protein